MSKKQKEFLERDDGQIECPHCKNGYAFQTCPNCGKNVFDKIKEQQSK